MAKYRGYFENGIFMGEGSTLTEVEDLGRNMLSTKLGFSLGQNIKYSILTENGSAVRSGYMHVNK